MEETHMEIDYSTPHSPITVRNLTYLSDMNGWLWEPPRTIVYPKNKLYKTASQIIRSLITFPAEPLLNVRPMKEELLPEAGGDESSTPVETPSPQKNPQSPSRDSGLASGSDELHRRESETFWKAPKPRIFENYLVPFDNDWVKARLTNINGDSFELVDQQNNSICVDHKKFMASTEPVSKLLNVGSRVLVTSYKIANVAEVSIRMRTIYKMGVVAEYPHITNEFRYLVLLDNGTWSYAKSTAVLPLIYSSKKIWKDIPEANRVVVKGLLSGCYSPLMQFRAGQVIKMAGKKDFKLCEVLALDCSLVSLRYRKRKTTEWVHRGSPSLRLIGETFVFLGWFFWLRQ